MKNVISYSKLTGKNALPLAKLIEQAIAHTKTGKDKIQLASVAVIYHGAKHGTCLADKVDYLVEGLGDGINKAALQQFFINCGYVFEQDKEQSRLVCTGWDKDKARSQDTLEYAKSTYWTSTVKQAEAKVWNLEDAFEAFMKVAAAKQNQIDKIVNSTLSDEEKSHKLSLVEFDVDLMRKLNKVKGKVPDQDTISIEDHILSKAKAA